MENDFITAAHVDRLPSSGGMEVTLNGRKIALFKTAEGFFAVDGSCPHRGGPLFAGWVENGKVYCPLHGWGFDLRTGICRDHPERPVKSYEVRVHDGEIQVKLSDVS